MRDTKIQWATNTFNPWEGCVKVSAGCKNCYAETRSERFKSSKWGGHASGGTRVVRSEAYWKEPARWNRDAAWCGNMVCKMTATSDAHRAGNFGPNGNRCSCGLAVERPRVFCASLADIFEDWRGHMLDCNGNMMWRRVGNGQWVCKDIFHDTAPLTMDHVRRRMFDLIRATPGLDWLLVTKRPENIAAMMPEYATFGSNELTGEPLRPPAPWPNVWLLASVEDQEAAERRVYELLKVPAVVHGLSMEPLLGPLDLTRIRLDSGYTLNALTGQMKGGITRDIFQVNRLGWGIAGGESGADARACAIDNLRGVVRQFQAAKVPVFVKQLGAAVEASDGIDPIDQFPGSPKFRQGRDERTALVTLHDPKGGDMGEWPADLRVREFPTPATGA